jgi:hypothetical protein
VTTDATSLKPSEQFSSLPLHDAILRELHTDWSRRVCIAEISAFVQAGQPAVARQIIWHGVSEVLIPHRSPWGESEFINTARFESGSVFILEMQSGDEIRIVAEMFEFR